MTPRGLSRGFATAIATVALIAACSGGSAGPTPTGQPQATPAPGEIEDAWRASASLHRGNNGERFDYECPAGGEPGTVWGTDVYTDDSSVCTAAVHAGAITIEEGGTVTIEIRPGEDEYQASERNGIESQSYPAWGGSFVVIVDD